MPRTKKESADTSTTPTELNSNQVWDVLEFANNLYFGMNGFGYYTPQVQNQNELNLNNTNIKVTYDDILKALENSKENQEKLQAYSQNMEWLDAIYGKTLKLYDNMLSFNWYYDCVNASGSEYASQAYKDDLKRVYKFFDNFNHREEFRNITKQVLRNGVFYGWFRDSYGTIGDNPIDLDYSIKRQQKFSVQTMPKDYCLLTRKWEGGMIYDFNLAYFLQPMVDISLFDPSFYKKFREAFNANTDKYVPSNPLGKRGGQFVYWSQCDPLDGMICVKYDTDNFKVVPPLSSLMKSVFNNTAIEKLQLDKDMISAYMILHGEMQLLDKANTQVKNNFAIEPQTLGQMMNLVKASVQNNIKTLAMPTVENKLGQYTDQNPMMSQYQYQSSTAQGAGASSIVYSTSKASQTETLNGLTFDYNSLAHLYRQFEAILNLYVNKKTKSYKFKIHLDGGNYPHLREEREKRLDKMMAVGIVPNVSYIANVWDIQPQSLDRMMDEAKYGGLTDKLVMLLNKNTMSGVGGEVGNPTKPNSELADGGATSRDYD